MGDKNWRTLYDSTIKVETAVNSKPAEGASGTYHTVTIYGAKTSTPGNLSCQLQGTIDGKRWVDIETAGTLSADGTIAITTTKHFNIYRVEFTSAATTDSSNYWTVEAQYCAK